MYVKVITDLEEEPVTLEEAKAWLKIEDFTTDDTLVETLIKSSRILLEGYTGTSFGTKELEVIIDITQKIDVPYAPLQTMTKVERRENEGWVDCVENTDFWIIGDTIKVNLPAMYRLTYVAGFEELPENLKTDIKVMVAWQFENRGIKFTDTIDATNYPFMHLLNSRQYRRVVI